METKGKKLSVIQNKCEFTGYDASKLLKETSTIRELTKKGQELIESITDLLEWMRKWSKK